MNTRLFVTAFVLGLLVSWQGSVAAQGESPPAEETAGKKTTGVVAYLLVGQRRPLLPSLEILETSEQYQLLKRTTIAFLRSKSLLTRALRDPSISNAPLVKEQVDPVQWLEENLTFEYPNDGEFLRVRLRSHRSEDAAKVLDAVVATYFKEVVEKEILDRQKEELLLRKLYEEKRDRIVRLSQDVLGMKKDVGKEQAQDNPEIELRQAQIKQLQTIADALDARSQQLQIQKHERSRVQRMDDAIIEIFREPPKNGV